SRRDAGFDLSARERYLAIFPDHPAFGPYQNGRIKDKVLVALDQSRHQVETMLVRELAKVFSRRTRDRLRRLEIAKTIASLSQGLGQYHQVGFLPRRLFNHRGELPAIVHARFSPCG